MKNTKENDEKKKNLVGIWIYQTFDEHSGELPNSPKVSDALNPFSLTLQVHASSKLLSTSPFWRSTS